MVQDLWGVKVSYGCKVIPIAMPLILVSSFIFLNDYKAAKKEFKCFDGTPGGKLKHFTV